MGLETGNRIPDLVASNPPGTDPKSEGADHLRLIKACVQGSFPGIGSDQVAATAAELDLAITSLQPDVAVIDDLADVDTATTPPADGDLLVWDTDKWIPQTAPDPVPVKGFYHATGMGQGSSFSKRLYFTTAVSDSTDSALVTIDNSTTRGWKLTALAPVIVDLSIAYSISEDDNYFTVNFGNDDDVTASNTSTASRLCFGGTQSVGFPTSPGNGQSSAEAQLATDDVLTIHRQDSMTTSGAAQFWFIRLSVRAV